MKSLHDSCSYLSKSKHQPHPGRAIQDIPTAMLLVLVEDVAVVMMLQKHQRVSFHLVQNFPGAP